MDRLDKLRGDEGTFREPPPISLNSESKDVPFASTSGNSKKTASDTNQLITTLPLVGVKNDLLDSYKIGKQIEAANILSGGVNIFDDNDNSYDGDELVIDDNVETDDKSNSEIKLTEPMMPFQKQQDIVDTPLSSAESTVASKDMEVILQIDGKNVDAIDIGNNLYLYRKEGDEELAAVQIIDAEQEQPTFKFLKVRENAEGNLEVYEEIEIEVPKEVPTPEGNSVDKMTPHVPIKDINKVINDPGGNKIAERKTKAKEILSTNHDKDSNKDMQNETKLEVNSPLLNSFTSTWHATSIKEGIPLTKTMVDLQLHPSRQSDNVKKTIEVHTDSNKQRFLDTQTKSKDSSNESKLVDPISNKEVSSNVKSVLACKSKEVDSKPQSKESSPELISKSDEPVKKTEEPPVAINNISDPLSEMKILKDTEKSKKSTESIRIEPDLKKPVENISQQLNSANECVSKDKIVHDPDLKEDSIKTTETIEVKELVTKNNTSNELFPESNTVSYDEFKKNKNEKYKGDKDKEDSSKEDKNKQDKSKEDKNKEEKNKEDKNTVNPREDTQSNINKIDQNIHKKTTTFKDNLESKPASAPNNKAAVPFGKWTEANRQEFLNKIKETKVTSHNSNAKPLKQPNDLNRRDVLKKIDSQRQSNMSALKVQKYSNIQKQNAPKEPLVPINKPTTPISSKVTTKTETTLEAKSNITKNISKQEIEPKIEIDSEPAISKKETTQRKDINYQDLIDKTIEGIINRTSTSKINQDEDKSASQIVTNNSTDNLKNEDQASSSYNNSSHKSSSTLDAIEVKMNELHGIPFIERPPHELPQAHSLDLKSKSEHTNAVSNKPSIMPKLIPFPDKSQQKIVKENIIEVDSDEEIIEHEPITGDVEVNKNKSFDENHKHSGPKLAPGQLNKDNMITEKDFDKFVRRNSKSYENCLTVKFDGKEPHDVIQTVIEKDVISKTIHKDSVPIKKKVTQSPKTILQNPGPNKTPTTTKTKTTEDNYNKNHPTKLQMAYQSALTAKHRIESPITIIEDKPVKVVFMDSYSDYVPVQLNVQGQELATKKDSPTIRDSPSSNVIELDVSNTVVEGKSCDDTKIKSKHQRKQILMPVEAPEIELIEPSDLGIEVSPKKKRKTDESKSEKNQKSVIPKKSYLLAHSTDDENKKVISPKPRKDSLKETLSENKVSTNLSTTCAIDNLVKAAELLETQSENKIDKEQTNESQQSTPVKRGRGRPRKYPVSDQKQKPSPRSKLRLEDKNLTPDTETDEDDSSDEELIKENWTMGKINENIVCPICSKLFRSENVVFKHVKHCTGPSPNRSDSDRQSAKSRRDQDTDVKSNQSVSNDKTCDDNREKSKKISKKHKLKHDNVDELDKSTRSRGQTMEKKIVKKTSDKNNQFIKQQSNTKSHDKTNDLVCEFCGKSFRQLSMLMKHKMQHKKENLKKLDTSNKLTSRSIFTCNVCNKEFRKLHHLVQHRIIHNSSKNAKNTSDQNVHKSSKDYNIIKQNEEQTAAFRCEPCDKSFRKLHHLVEHRETHDGINRQKNILTTQPTAETTLHCEICDKTFRKLHHLVEHKEQHLDTISEKSDDKSIKSSLSTKDIIHECSLCYMVFPNEHSLNKHTVICQKKKRQSNVKQINASEDKNENDEPIEIQQHEDRVIEDGLKLQSPKLELDESQPSDISSQNPTQRKISDSTNEAVKGSENIMHTEDSIKTEITEKSQKNQCSDTAKNNAPQRKTSVKEEVILEDTKPLSDCSMLLPKDNGTTFIETSSDEDDDDVRYMLNPNFRQKNSVQGKSFIKFRSKKRSSLQIERSNSKKLVKRSISLPHQSKISQLKRKLVDTKLCSSNAAIKKCIKAPKLDPVPSTDSDDSDVKYSFPKIADTAAKPTIQEKSKRKPQRMSSTVMKNAVDSIAKAKTVSYAPAKPVIKKSTVKHFNNKLMQGTHRCDCGQLFSSAALLSRHTTIAHTPPRIRQWRLTNQPKTADKPKPRKTQNNREASENKSETKSKLNIEKDKGKSPSNNPKQARRGSIETGMSKSDLKRNSSSKGVYVPEKIRRVIGKHRK